MAGEASAVQAPVAFTGANLPTYQTNGIAWAVASSPGLVFVGGTFTSVRPPGAAAGTDEMSRTNFVVLDAATGSPTSCAPTFELPADQTQATVRSLKVSPDGRTLYVGGYFSQVNGVPMQHLAAVDIATCSLISSFQPMPNGAVRSIDATSTAVYFVGGFTSLAGNARQRAGAVAAVGTANAGAALAWAPAFDKEVRAVALKPDASVAVVGGDFNTVNGAASHALAVVDTSAGAAVKTYPAPYINANSVVKDLAVDGTGFYTGNEGTGGGVFDGRIAVDWNGYTERWRDTCLGATQAVVVYSGVLYSGSHAHDCSSMGEFADGARNHFLAQSTSGPTLLSWFPQTNDGLGESIGPRDMAVASAGSQRFLYAVGEFTTVNGVAQLGITRFGAGPDTTAPTLATPSFTSIRKGEARVTWRQSNDVDDSLLTYRVYRDYSSTPLWTGTGSSFFWKRPQMTYVDSNLTPGSTHSYRVDVSDGTNITAGPWRDLVIATTSSAYAARVLSDGADLFWRYDELGDVYVSDATGKNNNGYLRGASAYQVTPSAVTGDASKAITLSGATSGINGEARIAAPTTFSVETWFKTTTTRGGKLIGFGNNPQNNSTSYDKHIYMANDGSVVFGVYSGAMTVLKSQPALNDGAWHSVVGTQGAAGMALYIDGVRVGRNAVTTSETSPGYWRVGSDSLGGWPSQPTTQYFAGSLDETAVYSTALSGATVADHHALATGAVPAVGPADYYGRFIYDADPSFFWRLGEAGGSSAADATNSGLTGVYGSGITFSAAGAVPGGNTAVTLSGTTAGLVSSSASTTAPSTYSEEAWFRTNSQVGGQILGFGTSQTANSATVDKSVVMRNDGKLIFGVVAGATPTTLTSTAAYNDNAYHHVVATQGSTGMRLYVDGALVASGTETRGATMSGYWRVGGDRVSGWSGAPTSGYLAGSVDEVAVYPGVLNATQVAAHYSAGTPTAPDVAAPIAVSAPSASVVAGDVALSWPSSRDNVGVTRYEVHRSTTAQFIPDSSTLVASTSATSYTDAGVGVGMSFYRIVVKDAAGNSSAPSNSVSAYVTDVVAPSTPTSVTANAGANSVSLSWAASTDNVAVAEYHVYRSKTSGFTPGSVNQVAVVTTPTWQDSPLAIGTYYYRVDARDGAGNISVASAQLTAVVADTQAPTVPGGVTATVSGANVSLAWSGSSDDVAVTGYDVYRSTSAAYQPSSATRIASVTTTGYTDTGVDEGNSYYRIVAKDGAGNSSDASTETLAVVAPSPVTVTVAPIADTFANEGAPTTNYGSDASLASLGAPANITYLRFVLPAAPAGKSLTSASLQLRTNTGSYAGSGNPQTVQFASDSWTESTLTWNGRPALTVGVLGTIAAGTQPDTRYSAALSTAAVTPALGSQRTLAVTSTGSDDFYAWSSNFPGVPYRPSLALTFSPNDTTAPTAPTALSSSVAASTVSLTWQPATDDVMVTGYEVHRSATPGFSPSAATLVGTPSGPSFSEDRLGAGTWHYVVIAKDAANNSSDASARTTAVVTADDSAPTTPGSVTATPSGSAVLVSWSASSDDVGVAGYDVFRSSVSGFTPSNATKLSSVSGTSFNDSGAGPGTSYYRVVARDAAGNGSTPSDEGSATVADVTAPSSPTNVAADVTASSVALSWSPATDDVAVTGYRVYRSATSGFTPDAATRIAMLTGTAFSDTGRPTGTFYYRVTAVDAAANESNPSIQKSVVVGDMTAPTAPGALTVTASDSSVAVSWGAASDDVAVAGYDIYRSATSGFSPSQQNRLATVTPTSYTDTAVPAGTWYYRVDAVDASANVGPATAERSVVVPAGAPISVSVSAVADTYSNEGAPSTTFSSSSSLSSRGSIGAVSYLRFVLPAAPAGKTLTGATLNLHTSTLTTAGSIEPHQVHVGSDAWSESTLTWNNQPGFSAPVVGTIGGGVGVDQAFSVTLTAAALQPMVGTQGTLAITNTGTDSLWLWSSDFATVSCRPELVLTYS